MASNRRSNRRNNRRYHGNRRTLRLEGLEPRQLLSANLPTAGILSTDPKDPAIARIGADLAGLYDQYQAEVADGATSAAANSTASASVGQQVSLVGSSVVIDAVASGSVAKLASDLTRLGAVVTGEAGVMVSALLPVSEISAANALTSLDFAAPSPSEASIGAVTSQGDVAMGSDIVRSTLGYDGAGVTVGVISNSYNNLGGAAKDVSTGDLPGAGNPNGFTTPVNVIQDDPSGGDDEGRAMLQIVHDVAPGANLAFATGELGQANFANNIVKLKNAGAKVIVDDLGYFDEPFFQDGVIAQAVETVAASGVDYFSAAANNADDSYQAAFNPGTTYAQGYFGKAFYGGVAQNFATSGPENDFDSITIKKNGEVEIGLQWESPYASLGDAGGATSDLDIYLINPSNHSLSPNGTIVASSTNDNIGHDPIEYFDYTNTTGSTQNLELMIVKYAGTTPGLIKYVDFNKDSSLVTDTEAAASASSTVVGHANVVQMTAVGAADYTKTPAFGVSPPVVEPFSSLGGTPILYAHNGTLLAAPLIPQQPNIVAPDGVSTTFFDRPLANGFFAFFGTSAAAPHAAAVAALMLQADPTLTLAQIQSAMDTTATSFGTPAPNFETGYGLLNADAAMNSLHPSVLPSGDIAVKLSESSSTVIPSATLTYTATVTNNGPGDAQTVSLTDAVPVNTTFVSDSSVAGWTNVHPAAGATGTVSYTVAALAPGASSTFTIRVQVDSSFPAGSISDTATVGASPADVNLTNNSKTVLATVASGAALLPDPANPTLTDLVVSGTPSSDTILFLPGYGSIVSAYLNGVLLGNFDPTGRIVAYGQAGNNYIYVSPQVTLPAFLYGGPGNDTLVAGGGNSVLVGGAGKNTLRSGPGSNILISGLGSSILMGTLGDNIEIGGYTDYDSNDAALIKLLAEWSSGDSYTTRVDDISGITAGGLNGPYYFNAVPTALSPTPTVHNNAAADSLYGGLGMNWYFAHTSGSPPLDQIFFRKPTEILDTIP
jgi:uncharacterized repeat protein (TIGR01451 family)